MSIVSENIKYLRKLNGYTQEQFARRIGIKRSTLGAYEEARAQPNIVYLDNMSKEFGVPVESMLADNIREKKISEDNTTIYKLNPLAAPSTAVAPKSVLTPPQKEIQEPKAKEKEVQESPVIALQDRIQAAIQGKEGYKTFHNVPESPDNILVGQQLKDLFETKDKSYYLLVTRNHGEVYCRVYNEIKTRNSLVLISDNMSVRMMELQAGEILEAWEIFAYISTTPTAHIPANDRVKSLITELGKLVNG